MLALPVIALFSLVFLVYCHKDTSSTTDKPGCKMGNGVTDVDGNAYTSVIIGTQEWTVENLKVTKYRNGDAISNVTDNSQWSNLTTGGWCYYNNDPQYNSLYGKIYNWYAVNDSRGLAPSGWHIPTDAEWTTLVNYLGGDAIAGGKLKEPGIAHWYEVPDTTTTNSCFEALPGGERNYNISTPFFQLTYFGNWWSSSDAGTAGAYWFNLSANNTYTSRGTVPKVEGFSIRCIKN